MPSHQRVPVRPASSQCPSASHLKPSGPRPTLPPSPTYRAAGTTAHSQCNPSQHVVTLLTFYQHLPCARRGDRHKGFLKRQNLPREIRNSALDLTRLTPRPLPPALVTLLLLPCGNVSSAQPRALGPAMPLQLPPRTRAFPLLLLLPPPLTWPVTQSPTHSGDTVIHPDPQEACADVSVRIRVAPPEKGALPKWFKLPLILFLTKLQSNQRASVTNQEKDSPW